MLYEVSETIIVVGCRNYCSPYNWFAPPYASFSLLFFRHYYIIFQTVFVV